MQLHSQVIMKILQNLPIIFLCSNNWSASLLARCFSACSRSLTSNSWLIRSSHFRNRLLSFSFSLRKLFISVFRFWTLKYKVKVFLTVVLQCLYKIYTVYYQTWLHLIWLNFAVKNIMGKCNPTSNWRKFFKVMPFCWLELEIKYLAFIKLYAFLVYFVYKLLW